MIPLRNSLRSYGYCLNTLGDKPYEVKKTIYPDEWKREASLLHFHDFPEVWYCYKGEITVVIDGNTHKLSQGQFIVIPIGMIHQIVTPKDTVAEIFSLKTRYDIFSPAPAQKYPNAKTVLFFHCFLKPGTPKPVDLCVKSTDILNECISRLSLNTLSQIDMEETCELIENIFSLPELCKKPIKPTYVEEIWSEKVAPILKAIRYINDNYSEKIVSGDLLHISAMGYSTFFNTFKTFLNQSFLAYLQQVRLLHCHMLFASTTYSMAYIATLCGFSNQSHMNRNYKKYAEVLPKQARDHSYKWQSEHPFPNCSPK